MNKLYAIITTLVLSVVFVLGFTLIDAGGSVESHPPHAAQAVDIKKCQDDPVACAGYDNAWALGNAAADQQIAVDNYLFAIEAERIAKEEAAKRGSGRVAPSGFDLPSDCQGKVVPAYIVQRESHCNYGAVNANGCGGAGCYGMYQIHGMHWNGGACSDLNWEIPADQDECARRLSNDGTNLAPWAF